MNKTRKISIKRTLLAFMLIVALIGVQVIEIVAYAADEDPVDQQQVVQVSTYDELADAIDAAQDGDVIGVLAEITVPKGTTLGNIDKTVTLQRVGILGMFTFEWSVGDEVSTIQNIIFDGSGASVANTFLTIYHNTNFENVTFKNCISSENGGAVNVQNGSATFLKCIFTDNVALRGGHIGLAGTGTTVLNGCTLICGHASADGGAISIMPDAVCRIQNSTIKENTADMVGGGLYNMGTATIQGSKVFKNTAPKGDDIYNQAGFATETGTTELQEIYSDETDIVVKGWLIEQDEITNVTYMKLDYEVIPDTDPEPTEVILAESSLGVAGDSKITGLDSGKYYEVTTSEVVSYSKADGTLTLEESEAAQLTGTEIIGLINGITYKVEEYVPATPEPEPTPDPTPDEGGSTKPGTTPQPNPTPDTDKKDDTATPPNSSTSTTNNDNSSVRNDYSDSNNTSTVNNYYTTDSSTHTTKTEASQPASEPVVTVSNPSPASEASTVAPVASDAVTKTDDSEAASALKNIRIEANGADCVFEINENGYNISINADGNNQSTAPGSTSSVNWYEIVKICLLAAIAVTLLWKPRRPEKSDLI